MNGLMEQNSLKPIESTNPIPLKIRLNRLSDNDLIAKTQSLAQAERELLSELLWHLKEIERRRLFCKFKCGSLYDYCTKILKYSEDQAYRRIQAARLLNEIPALESKIENGSLSLSNLASAAIHLRMAEKSIGRRLSASEKASVIAKVENLSARDAKATLDQIAKGPSHLLHAKNISERTEALYTFKAEVNQELDEKLKRIKGLLAHKNPSISSEELLNQLCSLAIEKLDPATPTFRKTTKLRREVFAAAKSQCENCGSHFALEIDHRVPKAVGGDNSKANLRILCRNCNQRAAIEVLGQQYMQKYFRV